VARKERERSVPSIVDRRGIVCTSQIRVVLRITSRVALVRQVLVFADFELVRRDALGLELQRCFHNCGEEAGSEVPVDVAVERPDACSDGQQSLNRGARGTYLDCLP